MTNFSDFTIFSPFENIHLLRMKFIFSSAKIMETKRKKCRHARETVLKETLQEWEKKKDQLKNNTGVKEAMRTHPGLKFAMEFFFLAALSTSKTLGAFYFQLQLVAVASAATSNPQRFGKRHGISIMKSVRPSVWVGIRTLLYLINKHLFGLGPGMLRKIILFEAWTWLRACLSYSS